MPCEDQKTALLKAQRAHAELKSKFDELTEGNRPSDAKVTTNIAMQLSDADAVVKQKQKEYEECMRGQGRVN
jgi:hypothetical protein